MNIRRIARATGLVIGTIAAVIYTVGLGIIEAFTPREDKRRKWKKKHTRK